MNAHDYFNMFWTGMMAKNINVEAMPDPRGIYLIGPALKATACFAISPAVYGAACMPAIVFDFPTRPSNPKLILCDALECETLETDGGTMQLVIRQEQGYELRIFSLICCELADRALSLAAPTPDQVIDNLNESISRMRDALAAPTGPLNSEEQAGLHGELSALLALALARPNRTLEALGAWTGPMRHPHDFSSPNGCVEVKATRQKHTLNAHIHSSRQLDHRITPKLTLCITRLEADETGTSLAELVDKLRAIFSLHPQSLEVFEIKLAFCRYLDADRQAYATKLKACEFKSYTVDDSFICIQSRHVPAACTRVSFVVDLYASKPNGLNLSQTLDTLGILP